MPSATAEAKTPSHTALIPEDSKLVWPSKVSYVNSPLMLHGMFIKNKGDPSPATEPNLRSGVCAKTAKLYSNECWTPSCFWLLTDGTLADHPSLVIPSQRLREAKRLGGASHTLPHFRFPDLLITVPFFQRRTWVLWVQKCSKSWILIPLLFHADPPRFEPSSGVEPESMFHRMTCSYGNCAKVVSETQGTEPQCVTVTMKTCSNPLAPPVRLKTAMKFLQDPTGKEGKRMRERPD